jgi:multisubunit Na+/H+ antiporter MnhE subunit
VVYFVCVWAFIAPLETPLSVILGVTFGMVISVFILGFLSGRTKLVGVTGLKMLQNRNMIKFLLLVLIVC